MRWIIEFKYYSNADCAKKKCSLNDFSYKQRDIEQIRGYARGLKEEDPEAKISVVRSPLF
ncbi:MAG: PD-(D/E)XK nuclease domain-containing protein [Methanospirillum hungatei]|nr:PD-(D/E)XK nuclease domain-containing protein [Methanospirillum hungatei]